MFDSPVVEVLIVLAFVYLLFSTIVSGVNEAIATQLNRRGEMLMNGIRQLLGPDASDETVDAITSHPVIKSLGRTTKTGEWKPPAYLPSRQFAGAVLDALETPPGEAPLTLNGKPVEQVGPLGAQLQRLHAEASDDLEAIRDQIAGWYDDVMEQVGGWYKHRTWKALAVIAIGVASIMNLDTINLAETAWRDEAIRAAVVAEAEEAAAETDLTTEGVEESIASIEQFGYPFWWSSADNAPNAIPDDWAGWLSKIVGIAITAAALTLGAPFWFDLLGRLTAVRGAGSKPTTVDPAT